MALQSALKVDKTQIIKSKRDLKTLEENYNQFHKILHSNGYEISNSDIARPRTVHHYFSKR